MEASDAVRMFAALGQETRLAAFRLLHNAGDAGIASGDIARVLDVPHNTLSNHLSVLVNAGLATSERRSRSIIYRACEGALDRLRNALA